MYKQLTNLESLTFTFKKGRVFYCSRRGPPDLKESTGDEDSAKRILDKSC